MFDKMKDAAGKAAKALEEQAAKAKEQSEKRQEEARAKMAAEAETKRLAAEQKAREEEEAFEAQRAADIAEALGRNISTGGAGVPYQVIDVVYAFDQAMSEHQKGKGVRPGDAFAGVKEKLWAQCQYLHGDAVLFTRFGLETDTAFSKIAGAGMANAMIGLIGMASRTPVSGVKTHEEEKVVTAWGYGTVVKLLPHDKPPTPDDYAIMDTRG
ncbi:MAG: hypothetical protein ACPGOV_08610 [Magnetovibrionaceae bacterium]